MASAPLLSPMMASVLINNPSANDSLFINEQGRIAIKDRMRAITARSNFPIGSTEYKIIDTSILLYDGENYNSLAKELTTHKREITHLTADVEILKVKEEL